DGSQAICERYCQTDKRFRLMNQTNQGQSVARNNGVTASTGEFLAFVDSDDMILSNYLETLMNYMSGDVDIVESQFTVHKKKFLAEKSQD
ncbi:glycosyltransferase family 2 protein, partial [Rhizobium leguminosarum]